MNASKWRSTVRGQSNWLGSDRFGLWGGKVCERDYVFYVIKRDFHVAKEKKRKYLIYALIRDN